MSEKVLALYDFASKQEYIYRTSKIREISGASSLLSGMYEKFISLLNGNGFNIVNDLKKPFSLAASESDGEVLYNGGGNLMMIYRDEATYKKANALISEMLLREAPTLSMIVCSVDVTGNFNEDRRKLYAKNTMNKNRHAACDLTAVTPFTQIDPMTFLPVTKKDKKTEMSLSADRVAKQNAYKDEKHDRFEEFEGMTAVIYCDGNSMGNKLKSLASADYDKGVRYLREFSEKVQNAYITVPFDAINKLNVNYRRIIGGGDEITIICHAEDALNIVKTYFDALENTECCIPDECMGADVSEEDKRNTACAGIAVTHAKSPFTVAYELAEAACESGKSRAHSEDGNYFDFYYCHAGATADFDTLRSYEQQMTERPYSSTDIDEVFGKYKPILNLAGRANVKALGTSAQMSENEFIYELERVNAYIAEKKNSEAYKNSIVKELTPKDKGIIYDMSEFYDLWFSKEAE